MIVRKLLVTDGRTERELLLVGTIVVGRDPLLFVTSKAVTAFWSTATKCANTL